MAQGPVTKRRRISPRIISDYVTGTSNGEGGAAEAAEVDDFVKRAAHWSLEQDYEQRPRKKRKDAKETTRLPIKTAEGKLRPSLLKDVPDLSEGSASETSDDDEGEPEVVQQEAEDVPELPLTRQILEAKEELARIAGLINEDPEENVRSNIKGAGVGADRRSLGRIISSAVPIWSLKQCNDQEARSGGAMCGV